MQDFLVISQVTKSFGRQLALDKVSLSIPRGEIFSLLGPSGCGKTTLLRLMAGFDTPDRGRIMLGGQDITDLPPERRPVNTVFQNYALFPHLTVGENIAFGLRMARRSRAEIKRSVDRMLLLTRLEDHVHKRPLQLSGGQRQRVAIARALVNEPQVLLLDEPLAALDLKLRQHMLQELRSLHQQVGTTFVYVTHDQAEALSLSHRIAVMNAGQVEQVAAPLELYQTPATGFVASFIGDANFLSAEVQEMLPSGLVRVQVEGIGRLAVKTARDWQPGESVRIMVRPESMHLSQEGPPANDPSHSFQAVVEGMTFFGDHERVQLRVGSLRLHAQRSVGAETVRPEVGHSCWVRFLPESCRVIEPIQ